MPSSLRPSHPADSTLPVQEVDSLLAPSYAARVAQQFFTHSAHAPLTILILEWLLTGLVYFTEPDAYELVGAALIQSAWLAAPNRGALWITVGNLVGVASYALFESVVEGPGFFDQPQHVAYGVIAVVFSLLQGIRHAPGLPTVVAQFLVLLENIARSAIPLLLYAVFEARTTNTAPSLSAFFDDYPHVFLAVVVLLLGILLGFADLSLRRTQEALRALAGRLHQLSSWGFGSHVVAAAIADADHVAPKRQERALLFMDIRGFTAWSEQQTPEAVVDMLDAYYAACEQTLRTRAPIKLKFTADEAMAVYADKGQAFEAARTLQAAAAQVLAPYGLTVGLGLHAGPVVEGMLGSASVKAYEVIGDAVNTASRLCSAAGAGELLVSPSALPGLALERFPLREIDAKGKRDPLLARVLSAHHATAAG
jgi:class 3 adenylate cyclase